MLGVWGLPVAGGASGGRDDGLLTELQSIGGFPVTRPEALPGLGLPPPVTHFHSTYGLPIIKPVGSGRREQFWPDEGRRAEAIGQEYVGRHVTLRLIMAGQQTVTNAHIARYKYGGWCACLPLHLCA